MTVYIVGGSSAARKETKYRPETAWAERFPDCFTNPELVRNLAVNDIDVVRYAASEEFLQLRGSLKSGDWLFVDFAGDDAVPAGFGGYRGSSVKDIAMFEYGVDAIVDAAQTASAVPVLLTPVARRRFDGNGVLTDTDTVRSASVRKIAARRNAPLIDLYARTYALLAEWGPLRSRSLYLHGRRGELVNYPQGVDDDAHLNGTGAEIVARMVADGIRSLGLTLADQLREVGRPIAVPMMAVR
ncbi:hypothetical protein [Bifidobacterium avesanii]|uniref:SGNH hydrolase-type esterase domain-containing protein n=1 Tax=Bifidobacterium avesanii TaxID=1798157 RepID=A0A7K3THA6_9BIFI|nr:hypothetical protein [Bifidobacterium avesanii]KAB8292871.1 GntR family transcriptional regulator [Bifidobacterium avesanii]NEG78475.1 hypothetical protein [Bifidobacterium avesanii]